MVGSPSHSVRDIQEPPRSWVGVATNRARFPKEGPPARPAARLICQARAIRRRDRPSNKRCARQNCRRGGHGPTARRASVRLLRQVESELSVPPRTLLRQLIGRILRPHGATVRRASSKRLTYCFDRLRMRTLGSLPAVPETPVVRNARQLFLSDDRHSPILQLDRRRRAPVLSVRTRILGAQRKVAHGTRWNVGSGNWSRKPADSRRMDSPSDGERAKCLRLAKRTAEHS
jgi:hypothetical protein